MKKFLLALMLLTVLVGWVNGSIQNAEFQMNSRIPEQIQQKRSKYVKVEEIPEDLYEAIVNAEDHRYYYHFGIDPIGITRAAIVDIRAGSIVEGGSTLTQQLAKNLFLSPERTMKRKIKDMVLAIELEALYSKREILAMYLNLVYFGEGAYGIGEAAEVYFQKSVSELTREECAVLAGIPRAPSVCNPIADQVGIMKRQKIILLKMEK
jgi:membrane peptidoglycan carboxypeptidase